MAQEQEEKSRAKVVDIGEWKVKHGLAPLPDLKTEDETVADMFISKFLPPEIQKGLFTTVKRPPNT